MREDLVPGKQFPDISLPETTGKELSLSDIAKEQPFVLAFVRGWWCPKEQVRVRNLVDAQEEIQREYGRIAAVTVDEPYVNGAFRAGIGADFPFLSDEERKVAEELDLLELTDEFHRPFLPYTFVLDSNRVICNIWCGFWYWGNPTIDELRLALREITRAEQPTFDPQRVWAGGGAASPDAGIEGEAVWIRENSKGQELWRGVHRGDLPAVGDELGRSSVDGRPWVVRELERKNGRVGIHVQKEGKGGGDPHKVGHHITAPR
ncbi:MAG TPA: redoxin domain-containing protein [Gaiellaceae bacterium]|jgi:peroxiredoxin|nr:redoxin domain-containing protein [Gaiellaceae bacterium]